MRRRGLLCVWLCGLAVALPAPAVGASLHLRRVAITNEGGLTEGAALARTSDGVLHVVYSSDTAGTFSGIGATTISPSGHVGSTVAALTGWNATTPGLLALPGGSLQAVFGGGPVTGGSGYSGPWGITSTNGGATWGAPVDVGSHSMEAFGGSVTAQMSNGVPVLTLAAAGSFVIQRGLGLGSPTFSLNPPNGPFGGVSSAVDHSTGEVVASWYALSNGSGLYLQGASPGIQGLVKAAGPFASWGDQARQLTLASLDNGPGVYAAYAASRYQIRLLRYGGTSHVIAHLSGAAGGTIQAGVATGPHGRLWVMWSEVIGPTTYIYVTRSNKARTAFEPVQRYSNAIGNLARLYGDGRLGPLDLLVNMTPHVQTGAAVNGVFWARILPVLSAHVSVTQLAKHSFRLKVTVRDAGDPVTGATAAASGHSTTSNASGHAKFTIGGSVGNHVTVTITEPGYRTLHVHITL